MQAMMERAISTVSFYFNYVGLRRGMANRDKQRQIKKAATPGLRPLPTAQQVSYCGGACLLMSSTPVVGCAGSGGGVRNAGGLTKSKNSVMSSAAASRAVRAGRLKRVSTSLRIEV